MQVNESKYKLPTKKMYKKIVYFNNKSIAYSNAKIKYILINMYNNITKNKYFLTF